MAFSISSITNRQSPTIGTSGRRTLPCSAGSMSTWIILASGANPDTLPVTRSSKREPSAMSRSAFCIAVTAVAVPCMPGMPRHNGCESGKAPRAINVVTTGIWVSSASSRNTPAARAFNTPPPTYNTGWRAAKIMRAASLIIFVWPFALGR